MHYVASTVIALSSCTHIKTLNASYMCKCVISILLNPLTAERIQIKLLALALLNMQPCVPDQTYLYMYAHAGAKLFDFEQSPLPLTAEGTFGQIRSVDVVLNNHVCLTVCTCTHIGCAIGGTKERPAALHSVHQHTM